jgi:hypothetical protein
MTAAMDYYGCVFYDASSESLMPPGYALNGVELAEVCDLMTGCPLTFEHRGIEDAVDDSFEALGDVHGVSRRLLMMRGSSRPVGVVLWAGVIADGSGAAMFAVSRDKYPRVSAMLLGPLKSVSLTTADFVDGRRVPIELSLCNFPARPNSWIMWRTSDLERAMAYKRLPGFGGKLTMAAAPMKTTPETETAETNPFKLVLAKLSDEDRALVEGRFTDVVASLEGSESSKADLSTKLQELEAASEADKAMLKEQIDLFLQNASPATSTGYGLERCGQSLIDSTSAPEMRRSLDRMLTVANRRFAQLAADVSSDQRSAKRQRVAPAAAEAPAVTSASAGAAAPAAEPPKGSALERAFARTFN